LDKIGIILAAGKGSRLNSYVPKPFQLLAGEYLLNYVIHTMKLSGLKKIYVVVSPEISSMDYLSDYDKDIKFIIQNAKIYNFLVGESLLKSKDIGLKLKELTQINR